MDRDHRGVLEHHWSKDASTKFLTVVGSKIVMLEISVT